MSTFIKPEDIRWHLSDDDALKNLEQDLFFSEKEILMAMRMACAEVRDIPPIQVGNVNPDAMPLTRAFIDGVVANLYDRIVAKIDREEINLQGSGISIEHETVIRNNLDRRRKERRDNFYNTIRTRKLTQNLNQGWASF